MFLPLTEKTQLLRGNARGIEDTVVHPAIRRHGDGASHGDTEVGNVEHAGNRRCALALFATGRIPAKGTIQAAHLMAAADQHDGLRMRDSLGVAQEKGFSVAFADLAHFMGEPRKARQAQGGNIEVIRSAPLRCGSRGRHHRPGHRHYILFSRLVLSDYHDSIRSTSTSPPQRAGDAKIPVIGAFPQKRTAKNTPGKERAKDREEFGAEIARPTENTTTNNPERDDNH